MAEAVALANEAAPEHLGGLAPQTRWSTSAELIMPARFSWEIMRRNRSATTMPAKSRFAHQRDGALFSPLSVDSFIKKSSFIYYTKEALQAAGDDIVRLAEAEGLTAHANSIRVRQKD